MTPRYFRVARADHAYLTFIAEGHEGLCAVSTVDQGLGIVRIAAPQGREQELEGLIQALCVEIGMEEVTWPAC